MLSTPLQLSTIEASQIIDYLYAFFHRDFIANKTYIAKTIYIDPRCYRKDEGKESDFWHLTTREDKHKERQGNRWVWVSNGRYTDFSRASRIEWVKQILINHDNDNIKLFYHQESNQKRNIRLYLWAYDNDFIVILQKLGRSRSFLVTSFYIDQPRKRDDYERRFQNYISGDPDLNNCEWF
ncbi:MAG: RlfB protein [gamma proteobacterium symbiont of Bathyaustriella thionipta]|nr:RlfB protein [gamma proteobacterium symbiont of Bathyaustriella thionipta]MCU7951351.1 RlfB protein [gamma proteobacterium symbiont of Bathyaustriella thionipta]MCU7953171.1 RlfB protein [gamma proteobacterium symbiont of Bathyaustriella thionipta]MCU7957905.1 RlfB protein [gamma proteobacterium symbiont of Bathyaustriella thionipta]MCU7965962.1 RlfB protein [gamma proteobacterium symbiont of Bathyaustriella thionipta]